MFIDQYNYDDLSEELQTVADTIGLDNCKKLMKKFRGCKITFPIKPLKKYAKRYILNTYNFENRNQIQRHLQIGTTSFYDTIKSR